MQTIQHRSVSPFTKALAAAGGVKISRQLPIWFSVVWSVCLNKTHRAHFELIVQVRIGVAEKENTMTVVYTQLFNACGGRIIKTKKGQLVAQVNDCSADQPKWRRASSRQAVALFRNAFAVSCLKIGDHVVCWQYGCLMKGTYQGLSSGGNHLVQRDSDPAGVCRVGRYVLPLALADEDLFLKEVTMGSNGVTAAYGCGSPAEIALG
jgi:hypothetical protein